MGILSGNPHDEPMHYGEIFSTWSYLAVNKGMHAMYQTLDNHTGDADLKNLLQEAIKGIEEENKEIEALLKNNGITPPPTPPERAVAQLDDIPVGARVADQETAAILSADVAKGLIACSTIMGQSIREDIGAMFGKFHTAKAMFGVKVLRLDKEKGWLIPPPLHSK